MSSTGSDDPNSGSPQGGPEPFWGQEIVLEVYPKIQAFFFSRLGTEGEDLVQETMLAIIQGMDKALARQKAQFFAWCYVIAKNKLNGFFRKKCGGKIHFVNVEVLWQLIESELSADELPPGFLHDFKIYMDALAKAKFPCAELLRDVYFAGLTVDELAAQLNVSVDAVRMQIRRCLETALKVIKRNS